MPEEAINVLCAMDTKKAVQIVKQMGRDTQASDLALGIMACRAPGLYHTVISALKDEWF
jgi:hypothetical protein